MGILDTVDSLIGTDLSGSKARKAIDKGVGAANAANAAAMETLKQYGNEAMASFTKYTQQGMDVIQAAERAANEAQAAGYAKGRGTFRELFDQAVKSYGQTPDYTGTQERLGERTRSDMTNLFRSANEARRPFVQAGTNMLQTLPMLQAALGLPAYNLDGTSYTGGYDVTASPMYDWQKQQLDDALTHQFAAMGINNDAASALIRGRNLNQLGAEERQRQIADMQNLVGQGMSAASTFGQPEMQQASMLGDLGMNQQQLMLAAQQAEQAGNTGLAQMLMNAAASLSSMDINEGLGMADNLNRSAAARAGMLENLGGNIGQTQLGIGGNIAQGTIATGQNALNAGISKAQMPNSMNALLNTGLQLYGMGAFSPRAAAGVAATPSIGSGGPVNMASMMRMVPNQQSWRPTGVSYYGL